MNLIIFSPFTLVFIQLLSPAIDNGNGIGPHCLIHPGFIMKTAHSFVLSGQKQSDS